MQFLYGLLLNTISAISSWYRSDFFLPAILVTVGLGITAFFIKLYRVRSYFMHLRKQGLVSYSLTQAEHVLMAKGNAPIPPSLRAHEDYDQPGL